MLRASEGPRRSAQDRVIVATLVPADHDLRQVNTVVDFER